MLLKNAKFTDSVFCTCSDAKLLPACFLFLVSASWPHCVPFKKDFFSLREATIIFFAGLLYSFCSIEWFVREVVPFLLIICFACTFFSVYNSKI